MPKQHKRKQTAGRRADGRRCVVCGAEVTPQWRKIPRGEDKWEACNRCGISYADLVQKYGREPSQAEFSAWQGTRSKSTSTTITTDEDEDEAADALLRLSLSPIFSCGALHGSPEPMTTIEAVPIASTSSHSALPNHVNRSPRVGPVLVVEVKSTGLDTDSSDEAPYMTHPSAAETDSEPETVSYFPALRYHENRGVDQEISAHPLKEQPSPPSPSFSDWIN